MAPSSFYEMMKQRNCGNAPFPFLRRLAMSGAGCAAGFAEGKACVVGDTVGDPYSRKTAPNSNSSTPKLNMDKFQRIMILEEIFVQKS